MRIGSPQGWAVALGVELGELPATTRRLYHAANRLDGVVMRHRWIFHECPDRQLDDDLRRAERGCREVAERLKEVHVEVWKELC